MTQNGKSSILVIDDEPDELRDLMELGLDDNLNSIVVHPRDVEMSHLEDADLVLVDYRLAEWPERDVQAVSLKPATGLALAVVFAGAS